ncbi:amidophosphoribosyltransferase [candidate division KSB1 bacterium]
MHQKKSVRANCGVVGVYGHPDAAKLSYLSLFSLQHRGQESAGVVSSDNGNINIHRGLGLVSDIFSDPAIFQQLSGRIAIGHNRYSTTGGNILENVQPLVMNLGIGPIAVSHNGNLVNSGTLRKNLLDKGSIFQTTSDSEIIIHLIAKSKETGLLERIEDAARQITGAYSLILMTKDSIVALRDPHGFRPLCMGKIGDSIVFASESCAFDLINAEYIRDVKPGEMIAVDETGIHEKMLFPEQRHAFCIFEFIYFSRPDSRIFGEYVDKTRRKFGKNLAKVKPQDADIVISVPDSSNTAALGYANASQTKFEIGLIRNHYIGRTFIHPIQSQRDFNVKIKFNTVGGVLKDKRVIVIEDSIVRGTTLRNLVKLIKNAGAKEVHVRVSSPPIIAPCYYGMDFPTKGELIANNKSVEEIRSYLDVDSLEYFPLDSLVDSVENGRTHYCTACFSGDYPVEIKEDFEKNQYEMNIKSC